MLPITYLIYVPSYLENYVELCGNYCKYWAMELVFSLFSANDSLRAEENLIKLLSD